MVSDNLRQSCIAAILGTTLIVLLDAIVISAKEQAKQTLGSSTITAKIWESSPSQMICPRSSARCRV